MMALCPQKLPSFCAHQAIPPQIDEHQLAYINFHNGSRILAKEQDRLEPFERGISHKYRRRKLHELTLADIVGVAHARLIEERQRKDVAEEYKISIGLVSRIACKAKGGMQYFEDFSRKFDTKQAQIEVI